MSHEAISLWTETSSDPELIAGVRAGDTAAFGVLYERHVDAARKVASMYSNSGTDVDDVVSESFSRVLRALQRGDGPDLAFRAYLFTIVRRTGMDIINKGIRTKPRDDMETFESAFGYGAGSDEPTLDGFEHGMVADAFRSLPERWQAVLWYTEVEKKSPREIAPLLGLSANGVAALSYRAREALRQAYLQQHLNSSEDVSCIEANAQLGAYVRGGLNKREAGRISDHIYTCERCSALVAELEDVNRGMRGVVAPLILGVAGVGALEGGLLIGGALGVGKGMTVGASTGTVSGSAASGAGAAGAGGSTMAAAGFSGLAGVGAGIAHAVGALGSAIAGLAVPIAAVAGVAVLTVAGAGYLGLLTPDDPAIIAENPPIIEPTEAEPAPPSPDPSPEATESPDDEPTVEPPGEVDDVPVVTAPGSQQGSGNSGQTGNGGTGDGGGDGGDGGGTGDGGGDGGDGGTGDGGGSGDGGGDGGSGGTGAVLAIGAIPLGFLEVSRTSPTIPLSVSNTGDEASMPVTATVALPDGLTFATPPAGSGSTGRLADQLSAYMNFALFGTVEVDGWTCTFNEPMSVATCEHDALDAGAAAVASIPAASALAANQQLASDAVTTYIVNAGGDDITYSVPTALETHEENFDDTYTGTGRLAAAHFGAPLVGCLSTQTVAGSTCATVMDFAGNGSESKYNNNAWHMVPLNEAGGVRNSATTTVAIPAGAVVKYASIEWAGNHGARDAGFNGPTGTSRIKVPGGNYADLVADSVTSTTDVSNRITYQARANITDLVAAAGPGDYSLADVAQSIDFAENGGSDPNYFSGFAITVIYELDSLPVSTITTFDGSEWVTATNHPDFTFHTTTPARVTLGLVAWDGDRGTVGDQVRIGPPSGGGGQALTPLMWNGTASATNGDSGNAASSTAFGSRYANTLGTDAKPFQSVNVGNGSHVIRMSGNGDNYLLGAFTVTITPNS